MNTDLTKHKDYKVTPEIRKLKNEQDIKDKIRGQWGPSLTVPDESYTVKQLLEKFVTQQVLPVEQKSYSFDQEGEEEVDINMDMRGQTPDTDLADITAFKLEMDAKVAKIEELKSSKAKKDKAEAEALKKELKEFKEQQAKLKQQKADEVQEQGGE